MMEIVKKNILSIICGVVALAAIVVAFVIVPGKKEELQTAVDSSKASYDALAGLLNKDRQLPVINPDSPEQKSLEAFPSEAVIKQGEAITQKVEAESKAMLNAAVDMNKHQLLVEGSLPAPYEPQKYAFRNTYKRVLPLPVDGGALKSQFAQQLNAGMPPSAEELRIASEELVKKIQSEKLYYTPQGSPANEPQVRAEIEERTRKLPVEMRDKVAATSRVYINPDTFEINPRIAAALGAPNPLEIYSAQLGYWIQQDVVAAVDEVNAGSKSIADSAVKNLIRIRTKPYGQAGPIFITAPDGTASAEGNAELPKVPQASPTARVSNGLYDVFHFEVEADVQADKLADFLRSLGNKRFITPLYVNVKARDNATALAEGLVYGDKPVVNVRAECEVLYLRAWNTAFMPPPLKAKLGISTDPAAAPMDGSAMPAAGMDPAAMDPAMDPAAVPADVPPEMVNPVAP